MKHKITWEVHGQGEIEIDPNDPEFEGMSYDEIEEWFFDYVHTEIFEQSNFWVEWNGLRSAIEKILEAQEERK